VPSFAWSLTSWSTATVALPGGRFEVTDAAGVGFADGEDLALGPPPAAESELLLLLQPVTATARVTRPATASTRRRAEKRSMDPLRTDMGSPREIGLQVEA
jgi:hypothetical protein